MTKRTARMPGLRLALALLAAGTCLVTGRASAQGTIVYVVPSQPIAYSDYPSGQDIDLNGDGVPDFNLSSWNGMEIDLAPLNNNAVISVPEPPGELGAATYALSQGALISSSLDPVLAWWGSDGNAPSVIVACANIGCLGYFQGNTDAYAGVRLEAGGNFYYGWLHIHNFGANWGQITEWAYETTPSTPIQAGQISEPVYFEATFNGGNEVPPNKSPHSGNGSFVLESYVDGYELSYHLELDGTFQPASAGIFGPATPMTNARFLIANLGTYSISNLPPPIFPPIVPVTFDLRHPSRPILQPISWPSVLIYDGQIVLSSNQVAELLAGQLYVNFKSAKFRQGELRGGIFPTAPIQFSATLSRRSGPPRKPSAQCGEATFTLSDATLTGNVALDTNIFWNSMGIYASPIVMPKTLVATLTNVFGVLIPDGGFPGHPDWPGLPGQVLYPEQVTLTDRQVSQIMHGDFYLNVLSSHFRNDGIGGRILPAE
jgi:hypothetical protein